MTLRYLSLLLLFITLAACSDDEDEGLERCNDNPAPSIEDFVAADDSLTYDELGNTGLLYYIADSGSVDRPTATDTVSANYRGYTADGIIFDQTNATSGPATFPLSGVIEGWTLGVPLIGEGGVIRLLIPSDLAYGPPGSRRPGAAFFSICPDTDLIFDIQLVEIVE